MYEENGVLKFPLLWQVTSEPAMTLCILPTMTHRPYLGQRPCREPTPFWTSDMASFTCGVEILQTFELKHHRMPKAYTGSSWLKWRVDT